MRNAAVAVLLTAPLAACLNSPNEFFGTGGSNSGGNGSTMAGDLPCDVADVLSANCMSCHAGNNAQGSVVLTSYAALTGPSPSDPNSTVIQRSLIRMRDTTSPMPPTGVLSDADIAVLQTWVDAGTPNGDCGGTPPPSDPVCSSNSYWSGCEGDKDMFPGAACINCHNTPSAQPAGCEGENGPMLGVGGTVFSTLHEKDDCYAENVDGTTVVITDANNQTYELAVRAYGNFYLEETTPAMPIRAEVRRNGKTVAMKDAVNSGDCNSCHSVLGSEGAAGRIIPPN